MSTQPEALNCAHLLNAGFADMHLRGRAATELLRLHALNAELARVLRLLDARLRDCDMAGISATDAYDSFYRDEVEAVIATIP